MRGKAGTGLTTVSPESLSDHQSVVGSTYLLTQHQSCVSIYCAVSRIDALMLMVKKACMRVPDLCRLLQISFLNHQLMPSSDCAMFKVSGSLDIFRNMTGCLLIGCLADVFRSNKAKETGGPHSTRSFTRRNPDSSGLNYFWSQRHIKCHGKCRAKGKLTPQVNFKLAIRQKQASWFVLKHGKRERLDVGSVDCLQRDTPCLNY